MQERIEIRRKECKQQHLNDIGSRCASLGWLGEVIKHILHLTYDQWTHHIFPHEQGKDGLKRNEQYQKRRKMMLQQDMGDTGLRKEDKNLV